MFEIKRRRFLQFAGSTLATLGFSQFEFEQNAIQYAKVLAQNTPRKKALLVGINDYLGIGGDFKNAFYKLDRLKGAVKDVEIQRNLLIYRFGFKESDIIILTDKDATRSTILQNLESLTKWAKPGDVVVFHFSGHGSKVADPDKLFPDGRVSTIVPYDAYLPPGYPGKGGTVKDITGHTLWLLMQAFNTENVTFLLDCCYSGGARQGIVTARARPGDEELGVLRGANSNNQLLANDDEQKKQKSLMLQELHQSNSQHCVEKVFLKG
jgi:uncharacterized caspase-like protein